MEDSRVICPDCDGEGKVAVTYRRAGVGYLSNDQAAELAGEVHHYDECPTCEGRGYLIDVDGELKKESEV